MYILSEKYVRTPNTHDKKSTHVLVTAGNQSRVRAFIRRRDAPRPRLETTRRANETNERTNAFVVVVVVVVSDETRPRIVHARVSSVSGKSIHWPRA